VIHGTFIVGLPGETPETIEETIRFAREINPHTIQVSLAAPYPGTELHRQALENGWFVDSGLVGTDGVQVSSLEYPGLSHRQIFESLERFYKRFYFRPKKMAEMAWEMLSTAGMMKRRLREGAEFLRFMTAREDQA